MLRNKYSVMYISANQSLVYRYIGEKD